MDYRVRWLVIFFVSSCFSVWKEISPSYKKWPCEYSPSPKLCFAPPGSLGIPDNCPRKKHSTLQLLFLKIFFKPTIFFRLTQETTASRSAFWNRFDLFDKRKSNRGFEHEAQQNSSTRSFYFLISEVLMCSRTSYRGPGALVLALALLLLAVGVCGDKLYPRCAAQELNAVAGPGVTTDVGVRTPTPSEQLRITCLAFEVLSQSTSGGADACAIPHQTEYDFGLYVQGDYTDPATSAPASIEFSVKDVNGGSVNGILLSLPAQGTFVLRFVNHAVAAASSCTLKIRAVFEYEQSQAPISAGAATPPSVVAVSPATVYVSNRQYTFFVFRHTSVATGASADSVRLVPAVSTCASSDGVLPMLFVDASSPQAAQLTSGYLHPAMHSVWKFFFDTAGAYKICYKVSSNSAATESSLLSVFAGNPAYYAITSGAGPKGEVYLNTLTTVRFYGESLDTRAGTGDKAKFVDDGESCEDGVAAGGVAVSSDLGPQDDFGPQCTFSDWSWRLSEGGSFKICYMRAGHGWVEVPSINDLGSGPVPATPVPAVPIPTPTNAQTQLACPMATAGADAPDYSTNVKLSLTTPSVPSSYFRTLAEILCLPRSAITMTHVEPAKAGHCNVFLDILCDEADSVAHCSSAERKNYLVEIAAEGTHQAKTLLLTGALLVRADGFIVEGLESGGRSKYGKHSIVAILVVGVVIIAVSAIVTFGVLHYKQRQHYFVQFGQDEDEEVNIEIEDAA
jgi:hypothetical protein